MFHIEEEALREIVKSREIERKENFSSGRNPLEGLA